MGYHYFCLFQPIHDTVAEESTEGLLVTYDCVYQADEQDKETLVRLLIDGFFILSRDPSWDVRTRAFGVLVNLGFEVSGNNVSSCKGTSSEISAPTLIKPNVSAGMSSFLPKSWQAKSWRSFSSPAIKQLPSEQMSRLSVDNESPITVRKFLYLHVPVFIYHTFRISIHD